MTSCSHVMAGEQSLQIFWLLENYRKIFVRNFSSKNAKIGTEIPQFWDSVRAKLKYEAPIIRNLQCMSENCNFLSHLLFK